MLKHAYVTGGTGGIGRVFVELLRNRGVEVTCAVRHPPERVAALDGVRYVTVDVLDRERVHETIQGHELVCHLAGHVRFGIRGADAEQLWSTHVMGTRIVLEEGWRAGAAKLVHCSSVGALGSSGGGGHVADESHWYEGRPPSHYVRSKREAHCVARSLAATGAPVVIAIPGAAYGPGVETILTRQIRQILAGRLRIAPSVEGIHSYTHVDDLADGLWAVSNQGRIGEEYILSGAPVAFADFCRITARHAGVRAPRFVVPGVAMKALAFCRRWVPGLRRMLSRLPLDPEEVAMLVDANWAFSAVKAQRELGFKPRGFEQGIDETIAWLRAHPVTPGHARLPADVDLHAQPEG
jgi:dihydroflavonol-4-reductase